MLKVVLMDLFPYLIKKSMLFNYVWKHVLTQDQYDDFSINEEISPLLYKDLNDRDVSEKFLDETNKNQKAIDIVNKYDHDFDTLTKKFFSEFKFDDVIIKFFEDAKTSNCQVVLINNDSEYDKDIELIKLPSGVTFSKRFSDISINNLEEKLTNQSIALNEFIYFSNDKYIIDHLLEKGYFCATISNNISNNSNLIVINSIEDLNFGNLALNFYDKSEESIGEL